MQETPKLFISYSWTTPEHQQWVIDLANELEENGIETLLDKWDLREGHDSIPFMERMSNDPSIKKVILICDKSYAEKSNNRKGGVGTESQIISPQIYNSIGQDKFVAVIRERDENGKPYLPTYYSSRIFIDLEDDTKRSDSLETLIRWVFDKPLHVRPPRGKPPAYISEASAPNLGTTSQAKRLLDGIRNDKASTRGLLNEYLETFSKNLERFRVSENNKDKDFDWVVKSADDFSPYRDQFIEVVKTLAQYNTINNYGELLHNFFESILPYQELPPGFTGGFNDTDFDNYKIILHELYLTTISTLLKKSAIEEAATIIGDTYHIPSQNIMGALKSTTFSEFRQPIESLEIRNNKNERKFLSAHGTLMKQRLEKSEIGFNDVMQVDFILFLRAQLHLEDDHQETWWPVTLVYWERHGGSMEIFMKASSKKFLPRVLNLLGIDSVKKLQIICDQFSKRQKYLPKWNFNSIYPETMLNLANLGSKA